MPPGPSRCSLCSLAGAHPNIVQSYRLQILLVKADAEEPCSASSGEYEGVTEAGVVAAAAAPSNREAGEPGRPEGWAARELGSVGGRAELATGARPGVGGGASGSPRSSSDSGSGAPDPPQLTQGNGAADVALHRGSAWGLAAGELVEGPTKVLTPG